MFHVFQDLDGCLADFDGHVLACFGHDPRAVSDDELWQRIDAEPTFWLDLPLLPDANALWEIVAPYSPTILTGCPKSNFDIAARDKSMWFAKHFGNNPVVTCRARDKPSYMRSPGDVLIDDFIANIKRWERAEGRAIYYKGRKTHNYIDRTLRLLSQKST